MVFAEAIDNALAEHTDTALARLDEARKRSSDAAREATKQLRDQLKRLNDLTVNLEARIAHARLPGSDAHAQEQQAGVAGIARRQRRDRVVRRRAPGGAR